MQRLRPRELPALYATRPRGDKFREIRIARFKRRVKVGNLYTYVYVRAAALPCICPAFPEDHYNHYERCALARSCSSLPPAFLGQLPSATLSLRIIPFRMPEIFTIRDGPPSHLLPPDLNEDLCFSDPRSDVCLVNFVSRCKFTPPFTAEFFPPMRRTFFFFPFLIMLD